MHLRALDASIAERAGRNRPGLVERGLALVNAKELGAAQLLFQAANTMALPGYEKLGEAMDRLALQQSDLRIWGSAASDLSVWRNLDTAAVGPNSESIAPLPFIEYVVRSGNREKLLAQLRSFANLGVQEMLRFRGLTSTVIFAPSPSASGQALDAAILSCGLLLEEGRLTSSLSNAVMSLAAEANRGVNSEPFEQVLLDLMSLGQRFNWGQLVAFIGQIEDTETLRLLTAFVREGYSLPVLFSAVQLSGQPADVARYLVKFSQTGLKDLRDTLRFGSGGLQELLRRNQRLYASNLLARVDARLPFAAYCAWATDYSLREPQLALSVKWLLYLGAGFLLAAAAHFAKRVPVLERPLQVRGFHLARETLFALGFLLVVLLLSEPFLAGDSQQGTFYPLRLRLPMVGGVAAAEALRAHTTFMNPTSLLTLLLFFVLQGLLYIASLVKLAEIRRQRIAPRVQLKLLENEDHLFDAGLYLGFVGTIVSLIMFSLGVIKLSLMAAYSSTSFGIIFVSIFKIFHLRPTRRKLLLEAETAPMTEPAASAARAYGTSL
jgi:hypothetical protein